MPLAPGSGADIYGVGGVKVTGGIQQFSFSAHEGPQGDFGQVGVTQTDLMGNVLVSYKVDVTCVNIHTLTSTTYDRGIITGAVTKVTPVPNSFGIVAGDMLLFGIKDGGNQSGPLPVDDFFAPNIVFGISCKSIFYTGSLNNVTQGDVNIKGPS
jgi:hypothetical protein